MKKFIRFKDFIFDVDDVRAIYKSTDVFCDTYLIRINCAGDKKYSVIFKNQQERDNEFDRIAEDLKAAGVI